MKEKRSMVQELEEQYGDDGTLDMELTMQYLLHVSLHNMFSVEDVVEEDHIYLPAWEAVLRPEIAQMDERGIVLHFYLDVPKWGKSFFECCGGMGNTPKTSLGMAVGSFLFSFMQGLNQMESGEEMDTVTTEFAGKIHKFSVFGSNIVGMGNQPGADYDVYWNILKEEIVKRLGNQKICFVKIYGAKMGDDITGECRIDDIKSEELSQMVARSVSEWDIEGFASQKQFFFIRQAEETTLPNPYLGHEGEQLLKERVITAAKIFRDCQSEEDYDTMSARMAEALGDATLAAECEMFLPEMCAENAFQESTYSETVDIQWQNGSGCKTVYKNQLADYYPIWNMLFSAFSEGVFGEDTNELYRKYIEYSSIGHALSQALEKESELSDIRLSALIFSATDDFILR